MICPRFDQDNTQRKHKQNYQEEKNHIGKKFGIEYLVTGAIDRPEVG